MMKKSLVCLALAQLLMANPGFAQTHDLSAAKVTVEKIAPNVAVLYSAGGNTGVSYGPDGTLLVDDQFAELTTKIEAALKELGAPPVRFVINTHYHADHVGGNENFRNSGATIIAHANVRKRLALPINEGIGIRPAMPARALPEITYVDGLQMHLNGDTIEALCTSSGHTDGDSVIFWRQANVMQMGDLFYTIPGLPFFDLVAGGNALHMLRTFDCALALANDETKIIPGHGTLTNKAALKSWRDMVAGSIATVRAARDRGESLNQFLAANPFKSREAPGGRVTADDYARAIWSSLAGGDLPGDQ